MSAFKIGFIGLGLIGGSIARALRASMPDIWITVYDIDKNTLALAANDGIANRTSSVIDASFSACDYIFLCAPVSGNAENLTTLKQYLSPSCVLTDVGSVKSGIHERIRVLGLDGQFIGGHPMAGSERYGYVNSKARLLENAYYILTPTPKTSPDQLKDYERLVVSMGAIPLVLDADQHDYVTAAISHLPHIIASSLVNLVRESDSEDGTMKMIAAGGFKDITRIASSSPDMWQQICLTNTDNIVRLLDHTSKRCPLSGINSMAGMPAYYMTFSTTPACTGILLSKPPAARSKNPIPLPSISRTKPALWLLLPPC